jgi:hypothetical protein
MSGYVVVTVFNEVVNVYGSTDGEPLTVGKARTLEKRILEQDRMLYSDDVSINTYVRKVQTIEVKESK